jgi:hypothetical protein
MDAFYSIHSRDGTVLHVSGSFDGATGMSAEQVIGTAPESAREIARAAEAALGSHPRAPYTANGLATLVFVLPGLFLAATCDENEALRAQKPVANTQPFDILFVIDRFTQYSTIVDVYGAPSDHARVLGSSLFSLFQIEDAERLDTAICAVKQGRNSLATSQCTISWCGKPAEAVLCATSDGILVLLRHGFH